MPVDAVEAVVAPEAPVGLAVDVKRNGRLHARIAQMANAWHLDVYDPKWTNSCADFLEAYEEYSTTCRLAGVPVDGDDVLTVVEIYRPVTVEHGRDGQHRSRRNQLAQVVQQQDDTWMLSVFSPNWNRRCPTVGDALLAFMEYTDMHPQRGPVGGR